MADLSFRKRFSTDKAPAKKASVPIARKREPAVGVVRKQRLRRDIAVRMENLPALPTITLQIMKMIKDPMTNAMDFERYVRQDQVLTARLLKIVNSSFYGREKRVETISKAVVTLGMKTLRSVVMASSTSKLLERPLPVYGFEKLGLWRHALATATFAQMIANVLKEEPEDIERMFVVGLLHDIGKVVLGDIIKKKMEQFLADWPVYGVLAAEEKIADIHHAALGQIIAQTWKLPEYVGAVLRYHHDPSEAVSFKRECAVVHLADFIAVKEGIGLVEKYKNNQRLEKQTLDILEIDKPLLDVILQEVKKSRTELDILLKEIL